MTNQDRSMYDDLTRDDLIERIETLEAQQTEPSADYSRRSLLAAAAGIAAAGAMGVYATGGVAANPSGTFPASDEDPLLKLRADRIRLVARSTDPSSPTDGTIWYRGDL